MAAFASAAPAEAAAAAWHLEDATRLFYLSLAGRAEGEASEAFLALAAAEDRHKAALAAAFARAARRPLGSPPSPFPDRMLEGGVPLSEALKWVEGHPTAETLELALSIEVNAHDRYLRALQAATDDASREVFAALAEEERRHVRWLAEMVEGEGGRGTDG